ncbi:MAG: flavin monoamine oxidase family protein [Geminicoccales bacterium]
MNSSRHDTDTVIIGAGLSGLTTALLLTEGGRSVIVLEAQSQPGGRIRSIVDETTGQYLADLGPTWVWPAFQPVAASWIAKLGLSTFPQYDQGNAILDYGPDVEPIARFLPGQEGQVRLVGGPQAIIDQLVASLPEDTLRTGHMVTSVRISADGRTLQTDIDCRQALISDQVIVATPPRIALNAISWQPALHASLAQALSAMPTWMAPHAKVVVLYDRPFWRECGLSGRIASQAGPLAEAYDHSGPNGSPAAIFGFAGWPHDRRAHANADLETHVRLQLKRCFGAASPEPFAIHIEDWAIDRYVTSPQDLAEPLLHPAIGPTLLRQPHAEDRLWFAGSETATRSPGLIEGAFDAAEQTAAQVLASTPSTITDGG